jgi:hypothetical protein
MIFVVEEEQQNDELAKILISYLISHTEHEKTIRFPLT